MSRQLEYYYRNKEKINKKFAEKYRNNIEFRDAWKEKNKNEQKEHRKSTKILTELEEWINSYIPLLDAGDIVEESSQDTLKEVLDKIQELKKKYKCNR